MQDERLRECPKCGNTVLLLDEITGEVICTRCGYIAFKFQWKT